MSSLGVWLGAARPRTLPAAIVPVAVGLALAAREGPLDPAVAAATLAAALLIQIGTNLVNDYYDFVSGADTAARVGPARVTQAGLVSPCAVRNAAFGVLALAAAVGLWLVSIGGWPILAVGVLSLVSAVAYTAGPFPLAYHGLGDLFVFVFFGIVAVNGTFWLQTGALRLLPFIASISVGCVATAILVVNNLRDIPTDRQAGKWTLAVRLGEAATRLQYRALLAGAFASLLALGWLGGPKVLLGLLALPLAVAEARALRSRSGSELNRSLAGTARLHLVFGALLSIGLWP